MVFGVVRYRNVVETGKQEKREGPSQEELFSDKPPKISAR
jgi:hypothetical protein